MMRESERTYSLEAEAGVVASKFFAAAIEYEKSRAAAENFVDIEDADSELLTSMRRHVVRRLNRNVERLLPLADELAATLSLRVDHNA